MREKRLLGFMGSLKSNPFSKFLVEHFLGPLGTIFAQNFYITPEQTVVRDREPFHLVSRRILHMETAHWRKFWETPNSQKCTYYSKGIFWVNLLKSFDLTEKVVTEVYVVAELESFLKIWVAHFLWPLGTIFAQNFGITPEQRVVRSRGPFHAVCRRVLHSEAPF